MAPSPGIYLWQTETRTIAVAEVGVIPGATSVHILFRPEDVRALLDGLDVEPTTSSASSRKISPLSPSCTHAGQLHLAQSLLPLKAQLPPG